MTRSERFSIGYTYAEVTELEKAARALGLSVPEYIRSRALVDARSGAVRHLPSAVAIPCPTCHATPGTPCAPEGVHAERANVGRKVPEEVMEMT